MILQAAGVNRVFALLRPVLVAVIAVACLLAWLGSPARAGNFSRGTGTAKQFGVHEIVLKSNDDHSNPFETDVTVSFTPPSKGRPPITVAAFYDGDRTWRARLYVSEVGQWSWASHTSAGTKRDVDNPFTRDSDWAWHSYFHTEETNEIDAHVCDHYYGDLKVPVHVYHGEDIYEQDIRSVEAGLVDPRYYFRRLFWSVLLSGGSPTYGGRYAVLHPYDKTAGREWRLDKSRLVFDEQLVGLDHVAHIKEYVTRRSIDLGEFLPDDAAASAIPAPTPEVTGPSRAQCARRGREEYLIYLPCASGGEQSGGGGGSELQRSRGSCTVDSETVPGVRVDLRLSPGQLYSEWYRAADGETKRGSLVEGGDFRTLTSPWKGADVVLRLLKDQPRITSRGCQEGCESVGLPRQPLGKIPDERNGQDQQTAKAYRVQIESHR